MLFKGFKLLINGNYPYIRYRIRKMKKNKLIEVRKSKKISQADIATYLKISQTQYQKREIGKIKISDLEWERIASLLNVPSEDIYEYHNTLDEKSIIEEIIFLKEKITILERKITSFSK